MNTYRFFWIASHKYIVEAVESSLSVKHYNPYSDFTLFTTKGTILSTNVENRFNRVIYLENVHSKYWFLSSVNYMLSALSYFDDGEKIVYLDTDTHVCASLNGIFEALDRFDFVGAHAPGRSTAKTVGYIPDSFPEYNIGVQGIVNSESMRRFFGNWLQIYEENQDTYGNNDQAPLREAIWNYSRKDLVFGTLPTEYNFRFGMGGQVREMVRVLHGRSDNFRNLSERVNSGYRSIRSWSQGELK